MNFTRLRQTILGIVSTLGGTGLFLVAFLDSSFLTFPVINDLMVIDLSLKNPALMPYYALMSTVGSVSGCLALYYVAKKGEEAIFHKHAGEHAPKIRAWIDRNSFLSVLIAALLPPPTPFKIFVIAAGAFEVPVRTFTLALLIARGFRYFGEGFLAVRYGEQARHYLEQHKLVLVGISLGFVGFSYLLSKFFLRARHKSAS
jgi:membrane protein YqaA with SNARE-associated domain